MPPRDLSPRHKQSARKSWIVGKELVELLPAEAVGNLDIRPAAGARHGDHLRPAIAGDIYPCHADAAREGWVVREKAALPLTEVLRAATVTGKCKEARSGQVQRC